MQITNLKSIPNYTFKRDSFNKSASPGLQKQADRRWPVQFRPFIAAYWIAFIFHIG